MNLLDAVTERLERLRAVLADLGRQARARLARAVGDAAADAVGAAVHTALEPCGPAPRRPPFAAWTDPLDDPDFLDPADPWGGDDAPMTRTSPPADAPAVVGALPTRWRHALAAGARAYAWVAERQPRHWPLALPALAATAAAVLAFLVGPAPGVVLAAAAAADDLAALAR
jgi:hypothetical protein